MTLRSRRLRDASGEGNGRCVALRVLTTRRTMVSAAQRLQSAGPGLDLFEEGHGPSPRAADRGRSC